MRRPVDRSRSRCRLRRTSARCGLGSALSCGVDRRITRISSMACSRRGVELEILGRSGAPSRRGNENLGRNSALRRGRPGACTGGESMGRGVSLENARRQERSLYAASEYSGLSSVAGAPADSVAQLHAAIADNVALNSSRLDVQLLWALIRRRCLLCRRGVRESLCRSLVSAENELEYRRSCS